MTTFPNVFAKSLRGISILLLLGSSLPLTASTDRTVLFVANNGTDIPGVCGSRSSPCRSISQAIENASDGDHIAVGPGIYGDIDGDGLTNSPGEEILRNGALVRINKRLAVYSQAGAEVTIIRSPASKEVSVVVSIIANGASLGRPYRGFTVVGAGKKAVSRGIFTSAGNVRITGNVVTNNRFEGINLNLEGGQVTASHNVSINNEEGFIVLSQNSFSFAVLDGNIVADNELVGILVFGNASPHVFKNNHVSRNSFGFGINNGPFRFERNVVVANREFGFGVNDLGGVFVENTVTGNAKGGFRFTDLARSSVLRRNNIFGNGDATGAFNCGVSNVSGSVIDAARNYWGAPTGPGPNPADEAHGVCEAAGSQTITTPFLTQPVAIDKH